jgi:hypothetical protein
MRGRIMSRQRRVIFFMFLFYLFLFLRVNTISYHGFMVVFFLLCLVEGLYYDMSVLL